jgi:signal transduction histidine kinase
LTVIRTVGEVALREPQGEEKYKDTLANILEETDRLRHLVDSLLTLSRADAGQVSLHLEWVNVSDLAKEVISHLSVLAEEKDQELVFGTSSSVSLSIDRVVVRQAMINIIHNAIKYCPGGSKIKITLEGAEGGLQIVISDNGPGIPKEHHAKLFDRFYRVDLGRSRREGGSGLGLSIARWGIEAHGGHIELHSEVQRGTTFRIHLQAKVIGET